MTGCTRFSSRAGISAALFAPAIAIATAMFSSADTGTPNPDANILSIGGSVTEIVYALDQGHRLLARDTTSIFPEQATELPDVGYIRALSAEGVLSVAPSLIISEEGAGPPETIAVLEAAAIPFVTIPDGYDAQSVITKVRAVGDALGVEDKADELATQVAKDFAQIAETLDTTDEPKTVLFILSTQGGRIMASGRDTAADGIISLAGGVNAITSFEGNKPVTPEAISAAAPDVILMMDRSGGHAMADEELFALPALVPTPAAQNKDVVRMNGLYLLGFGPRTAQAALELNAALYGG